MSNPESASNLNNSGLNSAEAPADVNIGKEPEDESPPPEELEKLKAEEKQKEKQKTPGLSPEEQLKKLKDEMETRQQEMTKLTKSVEGTKAELNRAREKLGLSPTEKDPPSVSSEKGKIEQLKAKQDALLKKQKEGFISQQEKENNESSKHEQEPITPDFLQEQARLPKDQWNEKFRQLIEKKQEKISKHKKVLRERKSKNLLKFCVSAHLNVT